jgi:hypothetical protein
MALYLSARCLGNTPGAYERDGVRLYLVSFGDGFYDLFNNFLRVRLVSVVNFLDQHQFLFAFNFNRERGPAAGSQGRAAFFYGQLYVLRVVIQTAYDDEVFETTRHIEFAVL